MIRKLILIVTFLVPVISLSADNRTVEYWNIIGRYDKSGFTDSVKKLEDFLEKNEEYLDGYFQLFSWCKLNNDYSPLMDCGDESEASHRLLYGIYLIEKGKTAQGIDEVSRALTDGDLSEYFGYHLPRIADHITDERLRKLYIDKLEGIKSVKPFHYVLKSSILYNKHENNDAEKLLEAGTVRFADSYFIKALLINSYLSRNEFGAADRLLSKLIGYIEKLNDPGIKSIYMYLNGFSIANSGKYDEGIKILSDTLKVMKDYGFMTFRPETMLTLSSTLISKRDLKRADDTILETQNFLNNIQDDSYTFPIYRFQGQIKVFTGKYSDAIGFYQKALSSAATDEGKMIIHQDMASLYLMIRKYNESIKEATAGLKIAKDLNDNFMKAAFHIIIANDLSETGSFRDALSNVEEAEKLVSQSGAKGKLISIIAMKGNIYQQMGYISDAREQFLNSLKLCEQTDDLVNKGKIIGSLGNLSISSKEYKKARQQFLEAVKVFKQLNDGYNLAITIGNLGQVYANLGEYSKALQSYEEAVRLAQQYKDYRSVGIYYTGIGSIYKRMGKTEKALEIYKEAEKIYKQLGSKYHLGRYYANLANIYYDLEDEKNTEFYDRLSVDLLKEIEDNWSLFEVYSNYFITAWEKNDLAKMKATSDEMAALAQNMKDSYVNAELNLMYAVIDNFIKKPASARKKLKEAEKILQNYYSLDAWIKYEFGISYKSEGNYKEAIKYFEKALEIVEWERQNLRIGEPASGYIARNRFYYYQYIDTLFKYYLKSRIPEIKKKLFSAVEKLKERNFADSLAESNAMISSHIDPVLRNTELNLLSRIARYNTDIYYADSDESMVKAKKQLEQAEKELDDLKIQIRLKNPAYATINYPAPLDIEQISRKLLDKDTGLLQYYIQEGDLYIFYLTHNNIYIWKKKNAKDLVNNVRKLLDLLQTPSPSNLTDLKRTARTVHNQIISPVSKYLSKKKLIIIPDEILYYLPFEILIGADGKYMIENYDIRYGPSVTALSILSKSYSSKETGLFAMANPDLGKAAAVKSDDSFGEVERDYYIDVLAKPLPYTEDEVRAIAGLFDSGNFRTFIKSEAKEEVIKGTELKDFKFLHFATHGIFNEEMPRRSGLLLTIDDDPAEDGLLQYGEICELETDADLVVLSACKTGLGRIVKGEGLIGISRGFMVSGSKAVIVSLWNVSDISTSLLMKELYKNIVERKMSYSEALRDAKLTLMRMKGKVSSERGISGITPGRKSTKEADFSHPYFWAPFILIGDVK